MFCTKCGEKIEEGTKFCIKCGTPVNTASVPNSIANQTMAGMQASYREPPKTVLPQQPQTVPTSLATHYVPPPRNNLLIAMIVLSVVTIILLGWRFFTHMPQVTYYYRYSTFFNNFAEWLICIILAVALAQGYIYPSSVLKISAFIGLALKGSQVVFAVVIVIFADGGKTFRIMSDVIYVQYFTYAIFFLVFAIQLIRKSARSGK